MTTIDKKSKDLNLTNEEVKRLKNSLEKTDVDTRTREFFKSARDLYEKLKKNNFTISLEELLEE